LPFPFLSEGRGVGLGAEVSVEVTGTGVEPVVVPFGFVDATSVSPLPLGGAVVVVPLDWLFPVCGETVPSAFPLVSVSVPVVGVALDFGFFFYGTASVWASINAGKASMAIAPVRIVLFMICMVLVGVY
jgi:hypothetical protein